MSVRLNECVSRSAGSGMESSSCVYKIVRAEIGETVRVVRGVCTRLERGGKNVETTTWRLVTI